LPRPERSPRENAGAAPSHSEDALPQPSSDSNATPNGEPHTTPQSEPGAKPGQTERNGEESDEPRDPEADSEDSVSADRAGAEPWTKPKGLRLPKDGRWEGQRGNSPFIPADPAKLGLEPGEKIPFRQGTVDFGAWSQGDLEVPGLTGDHGVDMPKIHQEIAQREGWLKPDGTPNASRAKAWLSERSLTPHHAGGNDVQLIPTPLHDGVRHSGGAFELRQRQPRSEP
jgi:hypothetical protein